MKTTIPLKDLVVEDTDLEKGDLWFRCPVCRDKPEEEDRIIRHSVYVPFAPYIPLASNENARQTYWDKTGDSIENISVTPSIRVLNGCGFHGFINNGNVEYWID